MSAPDTSVSLLLQLRDSENDPAWQEFVRLYGSLLYGFGLRRNVPPSEIDDFVQDVLYQVSRSVGAFEYDRERGTFRSWLFQIARHVLLNRARSIRRRPFLEGGSSILRAAEQEDADEGEKRLGQEWEMEYRRQIFARAADRVRKSVDSDLWEAFWRTAVLEEPGDKVANDLGIALGTLYVRRSRMLAKVRIAAGEVEKEWQRFEEVDR